METTRSTSRDSILASIRQHLDASSPFNEAHPMHSPSTIEPSLQPRSPIAREELIDTFTKNLGSVGGHCHAASNLSEASGILRAIIDELDATKIAISDSPLVDSLINRLSDFELAKNADAEFLFGSDVGVTSAQWAIAETGTLVLESDIERHRLTSLIPPVHICVLDAGKIRQALGEILESIETDRSRTVTFITGASRTSDIELTLAIGVHGPRDLHVILITDH